MCVFHSQVGLTLKSGRPPSTMTITSIVLGRLLDHFDNLNGVYLLISLCSFFSHFPLHSTCVTPPPSLELFPLLPRNDVFCTWEGWCGQDLSASMIARTNRTSHHGSVDGVVLTRPQPLVNTYRVRHDFGGGGGWEEDTGGVGRAKRSGYYQNSFYSCTKFPKFLIWKLEREWSV